MMVGSRGGLKTLTPHHLNNKTSVWSVWADSGVGRDSRGPKLKDNQLFVSPAVFPFILTLYPLESGLAFHKVI